MKEPKLIAFEGLDGCGKTMQIRLLEKFLVDKGHKTKVIPSLSRQGFSGDVRQKILGATGENMNPLARQMFIMAAYMNTYHEEILPALHMGHTVLLDRTIQLSTLAYGVADGAPGVSMREMVDGINNATRKPDICFVIQLPFAETQARMQQRALTETNYFDTPSYLLFGKRQHIMLQESLRYSWATLVDGNHTIANVHNAITTHEWIKKEIR